MQFQRIGLTPLLEKERTMKKPFFMLGCAALFLFALSIQAKTEAGNFNGFRVNSFGSFDDDDFNGVQRVQVVRVRNNNLQKQLYLQRQRQLQIQQQILQNQRRHQFHNFNSLNSGCNFNNQGLFLQRRRGFSLQLGF